MSCHGNLALIMLVRETGGGGAVPSDLRLIKDTIVKTLSMQQHIITHLSGLVMVLETLEHAERRERSYSSNTHCAYLCQWL